MRKRSMGSEIKKSIRALNRDMSINGLSPDQAYGKHLAAMRAIAANFGKSIEVVLAVAKLDK